MKFGAVLLVAVLWWIAALTALAQEIDVTAFHNGSLSWTGAALGTTCQVQRAVSLAGNNWTNFQSIVVTNGSMATAVPMFSTSNASMYYRILGIPAPRLSLQHTAGSPGSPNTVSGHGYQAGEYVYIYYGGAYIGYGLAAANGYFSASVTTPYYDPTGTYNVIGAGQSSGLSATNVFNQNAALVTLSKSSGAPGSANTVYAYGYQAGEYVYIYYGGAYIGYGLAAANGYCSASVTTPYYNPAGTYNVIGAGQSSGLSATNVFNQNAALVTLSKSSGAPGSANTVYAYGYQAGEYVYIYYGGAYIGYGLAAANGYCSASVTTPYYNPAGTYNVIGAGQSSGLNATNVFNQNAALVTLSKPSGAPGSANTVYAYGYQAGEYVYIYYGGAYIGYGLAAANGYCLVNFTTPSSNPNGTYNVIGAGQSSGLSATAAFTQN